MKKLFLVFVFVFAQYFVQSLTLIPAAFSQDDDLREYYEIQKALFLKTDDAMRLGSEVVLNDRELKVNAYLKNLQQGFIQTSGKNFPPANYFYKGRQMIDTSRIYSIIKRMPKGSLLHVHSSAMGSAVWMVKVASYMPNCYMYTQPTSQNNVYGQLQFFESGKAPAGWELVENLRKTDPDLDDKLIDLLTFSAQDDRSQVIWVDFEYIFTRMGGLVHYYPAFTNYLAAAFDSLLADGVFHIEIRTSLGGLYDLTGKQYTKEDVLTIYKTAAEMVRMKYPYFTYKIIYSDWRGKTREQIAASLQTATELRQKYPDIVVGYDLVGEEDKGHTTEFFAEQFLNASEIAQQMGIDIPFYFHDGESTLPDDFNLYDAIALKTERIGHGINLFRFPSLVDVVKTNNIALEVCPLSNQILGYIENLRMHPASEYINRGLPVTISSDDPSIFNYDGLSYDFWSAFMAWELDLRQMKRLALNSIEYSAMTPNEKQAAYTHFSSKWDEFIGQIYLEAGK